MRGQRLFWQRFAAVLLGALLITSSGCAWWNEFQKGPAFSGYDESAGNTMRGKNPEAKASGFLYDARSKQIEKNLGGF